MNTTTTTTLTDADRHELVGHLLAQGWRYEPAATLSAHPGAATSLTMFRLIDRARKASR